MNNKKRRYSLVIVGAGPAGLTASIYASRYKLEHIVIGETLGGLASEAHKICNFPTEKEISGTELVEKMRDQVESMGTSILINRIIDISKREKGFELKLDNGEVFLADTIILASGTKPRKLELPDKEKYLGKGISYCATCDAMFFRDKVVAVVGGSDSANTASLYLAELAKKVYQIYRGNKLRGETIWIDKVKNHDKIEVIYETEVVGLKGDSKLKEIVLSQGKELEVEGLFIEIGTIPDRDLADKLGLNVNERGYIKVTNDQRTSMEGVWAAGDITSASNNFRQIITACSEGAIAAENVFRFIQKQR